MARSRWLRIVRVVTCAFGGDGGRGAGPDEVADEVEVAAGDAGGAGVGQQRGQLLAGADRRSSAGVSSSVVGSTDTSVADGAAAGAMKAR